MQKCATKFWIEIYVQFNSFELQNTSAGKQKRLNVNILL